MINVDDTPRMSIQCNYCSAPTWHKRLFEEITRIPIPVLEEFDEISYLNDEDGEIVWYDEKWELWQCQGCNRLSARISIREYGRDFYPKKPDWKDIYYLPEREANHHKKKYFKNLPEKLEAMYSELVDSINRDNLLLCASGLRALLEGVCADNGITEGTNQKGNTVSNLEGKINGLQKIVPPNIVKNLHGLRFLGNKALHELEGPKREDLELALNVIEDILNVIYDLDYRAKELSNRTSK